MISCGLRKVVQLFPRQFSIFYQKFLLDVKADKITLIQVVKASLFISNSCLISE